MSKTTSTTKETTGAPAVAGAIASLTNTSDRYFRTTITNGDRTVTAGGNTSEKSQSSASKKWGK